MGRDVQSDEQYSRRQFLRNVAGGAAALGAGGLLAACGSKSTTSGGGTSGTTTTSGAKASTGATAGTPKKGGTLTLASTGGGSSDTLDGNNCVENLDFARAPQLYDTLLEIDADFNVVPHLAESVEANKDATEWTIRVKKGVEFHNGKPFTIEDVLYTFNRIVSNKFSAAAGLAAMDLKNVKKMDSYTVRIPMTSGYSILPWSLVGNGEMSIVPQGYNPKTPVGTGPFTFSEFQPGVRSVFKRNPNYFLSGKPYVDQVVIDDYSDESSQVNALTSGQATCADQLSFSSVAPVRSSGQVANVWPGPGWVPFTMRLDKPPFDDVNVRQAMRLAINRDELRNVVYGGKGFLGNDIFGITDPEYDHSIPQRAYDPEQAKSLLKKAGKYPLDVTLVTSDIKTGATQSATVLKQYAAAAGINISLDTVTSSTFFGPNYLKWTFAQDWWSGYPYLRQCGYSSIPGAPWDETHWASSKYGAAYLKLYQQALAQPDMAKQADIAHEMMLMDYHYGGYIIAAFNPIIVGQSPKLKGVTSQKSGDPWVEYHFRDYWLD